MRNLIAGIALTLAACAAPSAAQQQSSTSATASPTMSDVAAVDLVWAKPDGVELQARSYRHFDTPPIPVSVLIDVHGGAWGAYDRTSGEHYARALTTPGLMVISIDFRQSPDFQHPAGSADVAAAIRWVRLNARELKADPDRIGLIGSSSGGHLALLAALRPDHPAHTGTPIADASGAFAVHDEVSAQADYVVAMWPVSDPAARYRYAQRSGMDRLVELTNRYFADEAAMWDASIPRIVTSGEATTLPPILVIQPGMDSNIPQAMTFNLMRAWQARDGKLDYAFYPGQPHAFGHRPSQATTDLIETIAAFISRQNKPD